MNAMLLRLELWRKWLTAESTIGELYVNRRFFCFCLEDRYRPPFETKVPGQTAIPCGTYFVKRTKSPRFGRILPLVMDVPGFEGIRIHPGNTKLDTEGCLLPGQTRHENRVGESRAAFMQLDGKIADAEKQGHVITLSICIIGARDGKLTQPSLISEVALPQ